LFRSKWSEREREREGEMKEKRMPRERREGLMQAVCHLLKESPLSLQLHLPDF